MQHELLVINATQLLENEHSGCRALLRDDKVLLSESCAWKYSPFFFLRVFWYVSNALSILFTWLLKMEDLSRMYRLYCKIPKGLDPVSTIFKQVSCLLLTFIFISTRNLADVHFITY